MNTYYLGLDIGGTKCAVLIGNRALDVLERIEIPTDHKTSAEENIDNMIEICGELMDKYRNQGIFKAVGISCGGPLDDRTGIIYSPPNLPGWDEVPITAMVEKRLHIPAYLQNDANACAVAEWKKGAGKGNRNMIFLTFGTGLGAGLILDGRLYSGTNGMAGEAGHIRLTPDGPIGYGKKGSFEGYCSGSGIKELCRIINERKHPGARTVSLCGKEYLHEEVSAKIVFNAAKEKDKLALEIVDTCARYLGCGLAVLVDILNPEKIVLGSIFVRGGEMLRERMQEYLDKEALPESGRVCRIVPARLGEALGDIAALSVAVYNEEKKHE